MEKSRYKPIEEPISCMIRILRDGQWYQQRPLMESIEYSKRIIYRLRRKGREINVTWLTGG